MDEKENRSASEFMETAIKIAGLDEPTVAKNLHATLEALHGVEILSMENGEVSLRYDPAESSLAEIQDAITHGGFKMEKERSTRSAPEGELEERDHTGKK